MSGADPALEIFGASALGLPLPSTGYAQRAYGNVAPDFGPARWLSIDVDGTVTVYAGKVEYGQGIRWGLAMAAAEELSLDLQAVRVVLGDTGRDAVGHRHVREPVDAAHRRPGSACGRGRAGGAPRPGDGSARPPARSA